MDPQLEKDFRTHLVGRLSLSPSTATHYIRNVTLFFRRSGLDPNSVKNQDIVDYLADMRLKKQLGINTRRLMKTSLEVFYRWFGPIAGISNPTIGLKKIKKYQAFPKMFHPDEIERMLWAMESRNDDWGRRTCAIISFLAMTGMRAIEFEAMKTGNIQLLKDHFTVTIPGIKSTYERVVPFGELMDGSLSEYFARYFFWLLVEKKQQPNMPLFFRLENKRLHWTEDMSRPVTRDGVNYCIKKAAFEAGIDRTISIHQFRHFYGTYSYIAGMDIVTLSHYLGHASIATTQRYIHVADTVTGAALKHVATVGMKSSKYMTGYSAMLRQLSERLNKA